MFLMIDSEATWDRIVLDIPHDKKPEFLELVGGFVAEHNISITEVSSCLEDNETLLSPSRTYNPEYVTEIQSNKNGEPSQHIITREQLYEFGETLGHKRTDLGAAFTSIMRNALVEGHDKSDTRPFVYIDIKKNIFGLRADKIGLLLERLEEKTLIIPKIDIGRRNLLRKLSQAIVLQPESTTKG